RGLPFLTRIRAAGIAIWPFDGARVPLVVEIYPRVLTGPVVKTSEAARAEYLRRHWPALPAPLRTRAAGSEDAFDAAVSALVLNRDLLDVSDLAAGDDISKLEGEIWAPLSTNLEVQTSAVPKEGRVSHARELMSLAKQASDLMARDRVAGEARFQELFAKWSRDGMLHFQRAVALERLKDDREAFREYKQAEALFWNSEWRARAPAAAARVQPTSSVREAPINDNTIGGSIPSVSELEAAHRIFLEREPRWADFDTATRLLDQALTSQASLTPAVAAAALLQSWNFAYYQD